MKITWYGTASVLLEAAGERILFDPFVQIRGGENPNSLDDFAGEKYICVTHGHLDHLMEVTEFLDRESLVEATVYCGSVAANTLEEQGMDCSNVVLVCPGMQWRIGKMQIAVLNAKHSVPGPGLSFRTICSFRMLKYFWNAIFLASINKQFPEGGETFLYEVTAEGKRIQIMGSLGLDEKENYQTGADLLVLPFQGTGHLEQKAIEIVERLQPKRVMLDHFDDAIPPVSHSVDTRKFKKLMDQKYPAVQVVKPTAGKALEI